MRHKKVVWLGIALVIIACFIAIPVLSSQGGGEPVGSSSESEKGAPAMLQSDDGSEQEEDGSSEDPGDKDANRESGEGESDVKICPRAWEYYGLIDPGIPPTTLSAPSYFQSLGEEFTCYQYAAIAESDNVSAETKDTSGPSLHLFQAQTGKEPVEVTITWEGYSDNCRNTGLYVWKDWRWVLVDRTLFSLPIKTGYTDTDIYMCYGDATLNFTIIEEKYDDYADGSGNIHFMARSMVSDVGQSRITTDYVEVTVSC
jgi:hypothetical protein